MRAGIRGLTFHDLRGTAVVILARWEDSNLRMAESAFFHHYRCSVKYRGSITDRCLGRSADDAKTTGQEYPIGFANTPDRYFDGATPVTHQVCAWPKEEVERLFRALPGSDGAF
jgi:hypothetical protein